MIKNSNLILRVVASYSIITSLVILYALGKLILFSPSEMSDFIFDLSIFTVFLLLLISNIFIISSKQYIPQFFLWYNIIIYFLQIFHFKIFGIIFDFSFGIEIMFGFLLQNGFKIELDFELWKMIFSALYKNYNETFAFMVSFIPILLFLSYKKLLSKNYKDAHARQGVE